MEESPSPLSETEMEDQTSTQDATADGAPDEGEVADSPMETGDQDLNENGNSEKADKGEDKTDAPGLDSKNDQGGEGDKSDADICDGQKDDTRNMKQEEGDGGREYNTRRSIRRVSTDESVSRKRTGSSVSGDEAPRKKVVRNNSVSSKQEGGQPKPQQGIMDDSHDKYCWVCHKEGVIYHCKICPRSFHPKCISLAEASDKGDGDGIAKVCVCPECTLVMKAENVETRSDTMKSLSQEDLGTVLQYICNRLKIVPGAEPFLNPVKSEDAEDYYDFIVYPMDIHTLEQNISQGQYGSTEAFMSDAQWILHNSIVFNSVASVYTQSAKKLVKVCKQELTEIETCPECYKNAHENPTSWFVEACSRPHLLVWAKLKGFPHWPAKAMKIKDDQVDARFFGEHDRAWVKISDCILYMVELPFTTFKKPVGLTGALDELNRHVEKLKEKFGEVTFATEKTQLGPNFSVEQIRKLLPQYQPEIVKEEEPKSMPLESKYRLRTTSKDSKPKTGQTNDSEPSSGKQDENAEPDPRVPDGEILASALGLTRINKSGPEPQRKSTRLSSVAENVLVKAEPNDNPDDEMDQEPVDERRGTKAKNLMEQISNQTQAKPGYRFNISKDISISAIEDNEGDSDTGEMKKVNRLPQGVKQTQLKGVGDQRFVVGKDGHLRPLVKTGSGVGMKPPQRTPTMQSALQPSMRKTKDGSYQPIMADSGVAKTTPQTQGAITLPGGSITVTPLSSCGRPSGGQGVKGTNGLPMNGGNNPKFGKALRAQQQITRNFGPSSSSTLPPAARILVQNCLKAVEEQISSTIAAAVSEIQPSTSSGAKGDSAGGGSGDKEQVQRLQQRIQRYEKEIADLKHGHSVVVKELKTGYEKRMAELKRLYEQDKLRQATELKKKQWCASCGREAMFYCCWNTSYCGYECQEEHWPSHMASCSQGQNRNQISNNQAQLQNGR